MRRPLSFALALALACGDEDTAATGSDTQAPLTESDDADGDGYAATDRGGADCDDSDAAVNPGAEEVCNGVDDDCDGAADELGDGGATDATTWYADADGDGYGTDASAFTTCAEVSGAATQGGDCDDARADVNPGAAELCDEIDNDCDGGIDDGDPEGAEDGATWYHDGDGDGYGDPDDTRIACDAPSGFVEEGDDLDDTDPDVADGTEAWSGDFEVYIEVPGLELYDTCSGPLAFTLDETADPQIDGVGVCTFADDIAEYMPGDRPVEIIGWTKGDDVLGVVSLVSVFDADWTGSRDDASMSGSFADEGDFLGVPIHYTGSFEVSR